MNSGAMKVIVVGAGRIGELHARNIRDRIPALDVVAFVEPQPTKEVTEWAGSRVIPIFPDLDRAIDSIKSQGVIVAVPTDLHEEVALKAIGEGLHVFCEKPVAPDIPAARRITEAAKKAGVILQIGFNRRFDRNFSALGNAIRSGKIGKTEMIRVTSRDPAPPPLEYIRRSGGLFMDMTIHDFDMVRFLSGDEFNEVHVHGASLVDPAIDEVGDIDSAIISFRLKSGAIGVIENSRRAVYGYDQRAEVLGSEGAVSISNEKPSTIKLSRKDAVVRENPLHFFLERYGESFITELDAFAAAVSGARPVPVDGSDGIEAMRAAEACRLSLAEGRRVSLTEIQ